MKILTLMVLLFAANLALAQKIDLPNPSFEKGTSGYWISKPDKVTVDPATSSNGGKSIHITPGKGGKVDIVFAVKQIPDVIYKLNFDAKKTGNCSLVPQVMLQGKKPIVFLEGKSVSQLTAIDLTDDWKTYSVPFGPVPSEVNKQEVLKAMIYFTVSAKADQDGSIWIDNISMTTEKAPQEAVKKK